MDRIENRYRSVINRRGFRGRCRGRRRGRRMAAAPVVLIEAHLMGGDLPEFRLRAVARRLLGRRTGRAEAHANGAGRHPARGTMTPP